MEEKTLFVFYTINPQSTTKVWTYGKFPKGWNWIGGGSSVPVKGKKLLYLQEEQFTGVKDTQEKMKMYLITFFDKLKQKGIIVRYKIRNSFKP